jgi:hypothetical protein
MEFPMTPRVAGQLLAERIIESVDNGEHNITNPALWPNDAVFGVEYFTHPKGEPGWKSDLQREFFSTENALNAWVAAKKVWITEQGDSALIGELYEWDWGPNFKATLRLI